ncbi:MAG: hypothetical protein EA359_03600 [Balneolaceae bacterium]|nr:MAG: hypothetical protein EA359_03600 [Balneolaceae bacterium]
MYVYWNRKDNELNIFFDRKSPIFGIMIVAAWYYYIVLLMIGVIKGWKYWRSRNDSLRPLN